MSFKIQKTFSCAHFYHQPQWSEEQNLSEFGKCFTTYGHGHDYILDFEFQSPTPEKVLAALEQLIQRLDHQHLNFVFPFFQKVIPTTENLSIFIYQELQAHFLKNGISAQAVTLRLQENPEIWVELTFNK